jgi:DnaD/phage-associated family protein
MFSVQWDEIPHFTAVPDFFIKKYMPDAPGNYVKVFLYLMMLSGSGSDISDVKKLSGILNMSESEAAAALKYWERKNLLDILYVSNRITGIKIHLNPSLQNEDSCMLSPSRIKTLRSENADAETVCFIAERYFLRPLNASELGTLLYFFDELDFSVELCEYLLEYCVSNGHKNINYIKKVALSWHKEGYTTPEEAKAGSSGFSKKYFDVLKAFGIHGRYPVKEETEYIDKWYDSYGFSLDIIAKACAKALSNTGQQNFPYADKILADWHDKGVRSVSDAEKASEEFSSKYASSAAKQTDKTVIKNRFINYKQRDDDLDALERKLNEQFLQQMEKKNGAD